MGSRKISLCQDKARFGPYTAKYMSRAKSFRQEEKRYKHEGADKREMSTVRKQSSGEWPHVKDPGSVTHTGMITPTHL